LFDALPRNMHLRVLSCWPADNITEACFCDTLLPAVRANTALCKLDTGASLRYDSAREAERIVNHRAA
jgi:hypothetical protein